MNQTIEQALHIVPAVSDRMSQAIDEWTAMYKDEAEWLHEPTYADPTKVVSLGLPAFIASEKARMAVIEFKSEITAPKTLKEEDNPNYFPPMADAFGNVKVSGEAKTVIKEEVQGDTKRAMYMNKQYQEKLLTHIRTQLEYGIAKGSLIIKPYVHIAKKQPIPGIEQETDEVEYLMDYDFVQADCFYPFAFDSNGKLSEVAFLQTKTNKDTVYTRLEYHKLVGNSVTIINKAFESTNDIRDISITSGASLGTEIELTRVPEWKDLPSQTTIKNVDRLLFGYFKMPEANTIDPHSPLGISGFARAQRLIRDADEQYSRLLWEYEGGELAIDIDRDALTTLRDAKGDGHSVMGHLQQRLYRTVDLGESDTYKPFAPTLRDASLINGLNTILMRIEDVCALSRGTLAEVANEARTATELKILKQRSYSSNLDIQKALETALRDVVYAMDVYCSLYNIVGDVPRDKNGKIDASKVGKYDVSFDWDDSILVDVDTELSRKILLLDKGLESKVEVRMWYHGEDRRQAIEALAKIDAENQAAVERNMQNQMRMSGQAQGQEEEEEQNDKSQKPPFNKPQKFGQPKEQEEQEEQEEEQEEKKEQKEEKEE